MLTRRSFVAASGSSVFSRTAYLASATPGITSDTIKIGQTMPYSGPASAYGVVGLAEAAVFAMVNASNGVNGRRIELLSTDDGYDPSRTVEETRRLVEADQVAFIYQGLGTAPQAAVQRYLNQRGIPQLFVSSGAARWADPQRFPWTIGWQPNYRLEARIYAQHLMSVSPEVRLAVLYQDDDFGRDYLYGLRDGLGSKYGAVVAMTQSYQTTDPTITSQILALRDSEAEALLTVATPKFAIQAIKAVTGLGWHPTPHYLSNVSASAASVIEPAGSQKSVGIISGAYLKDATDTAWNNDPGMKNYRAWAARWAPGLDVTSFSTVFGYGNALCLVALLNRCGNRLSRENVMKEATELRDVEIPVLLPGISVDTSPTTYQPIGNLQLQRWSGTGWERFGRVL